MEYSVLIENNNGVWRAVIPALSDLSAEGTTEEEAINNAKQAAEKYLSSVKIKTIEITSPQESTIRPGRPDELLKALEAFVGDEEALREHFEDLEKERQRQREEALRSDAA